MVGAALRRILVTVACLCAACSADDEACPSGTTRRDGACVTTYDDCGPSALPIPGGGCEPIGVRADACAVGFTYDIAGTSCVPVLPEAPCAPNAIAVPGDTVCHPVGVTACGAGTKPDDKGGCSAILPPAPCGRGTLALPGETSCHELASCGSGTFGDIAVDGSTLFVDQSALAGGDGTKERPFRTVQEAVTAAKAGANVAVAAGTYEENVDVAKPLRIVGRCPSMVEIRGVGGAPAAFLHATGAELQRVAVTGPAGGVDLAGGAKVDRVWTHDTGDVGLVMHKLGAGIPSVTGSLVEGSRRIGIALAAGVVGKVEKTVIRRTRAHVEAPEMGHGLHVQDGSTLEAREVPTDVNELVSWNQPLMSRLSGACS
ncbi:MAG: DUF1565 domain-containing protein [Deltaproteobacteria bacterium]|nr:DUF1565 domain-containing protein [Deltaproteobacteria bacterium]